MQGLLVLFVCRRRIRKARSMVQLQQAADSRGIGFLRCERQDETWMFEPLLPPHSPHCPPLKTHTLSTQSGVVDLYRKNLKVAEGGYLLSFLC